jgi:hypothetical protein
MRRVSVLALVVVLAVAALFAAGAVGPDTAAQEDGTPAAPAGHPAIGTWVLTEEDEAPSITILHDDGTALDVASDGVLAGSWEATGPTTAELTFLGVFEEEGFGATIQIRATIEVEAAGDTFTAPYSFTLVGADGTVLDSGTGVVTATRLPVEAAETAGTPIAAVPTWVPAPPEDGPPAGEATPTAGG